MNIWQKYSSYVKSICAKEEQVKDLVYWRNNLFAAMLTYLLPFCLIALIPGLYWIFVTGQFSIAVVDLATVTGMTIVAFVPGINQSVRKIIFISCIYLFSIAILYFVGLTGPGMVYLLAACVFSILIFPGESSFFPACLNTGICILFGVAIMQNWVSWPSVPAHLIGEWIAVSSNLVFLSLLSAALIPRLFNGLQETIEKEQQLTDKVNKQQASLEQALSLLQQKNNELEQFAYVASHDLKEPLRMVTNFIGLLKIKYGDQLDQKAHSYIDFAIDGGKRMQRMIADLLELSRTARQDGDRESINMMDVLLEVKQNIHQLINENNAVITSQEIWPVLLANRMDLIRLLQNLFSNAIKFRKKEVDPVIHVGVTEQSHHWLFSIRDNGIGIEKDNAGKIFEIFSRLHSQAEYDGTGIGLAICKKIVERAGGEIWVESTLGEGSVFYFTILK